MRGTFRLIRKNPFGFLFATIISCIVVVVLSVGMIRLPYIIYTDSLSKKILSNVSGVMPVVSKYTANPVLGECVFEDLKILNSSEFDTSNFKNENGLTPIVAKREMLEIKKLKVYIKPLSVFSKKPQITGFEMEIENLNAIRITPRVYNILKFIDGIADELETNNGKINKFVVKIKTTSKEKQNVSYLDFSSSRDIININRNETFEFSEIGEQNIKNTLAKLAKECNMSMPFISRAILSHIEK